MPPQEIFETGNEPDFTIDDIARVEYLSGGGVRLYLGAEWNHGLRVEYSVRVLSLEKLAEFGRALLIIAAKAHNREQGLPVVEH